MDFNKFIDSIKRGLRTLAWVLKRNIRPPQLPVNDDRKTLLHLGCGPINAHGFINIDAQPLPHVHYVSDVFPLRMFPSDCADLIYASHILEHFPWVKTREVLKEWRRVLKPGGVLRLGVPDFEVLLDIYKDTNDLGEIRGPLMGGGSLTNITFIMQSSMKEALPSFLTTLGLMKFGPGTLQKLTAIVFRTPLRTFGTLMEKAMQLV